MLLPRDAQIAHLSRGTHPRGWQLKYVVVWASVSSLREVGNQECSVIEPSQFYSGKDVELAVLEYQWFLCSASCR